MTKLVQFLKRTWEKYIGTWYEGPDAPSRLLDLSVDFANRHPLATRMEWVMFATEHAAEAYRQGWLRGYEYVERDRDWHRFVGDADPDSFADTLYPDWRQSAPVELQAPYARVLPQEPNDQDLIEHLMNMVRRQDERRK